MKKLFAIFLLMSLLLCACGSRTEMTDDEINTMLPTQGCVDGKSAVFQSVFSSGSLFVASFFPRLTGAVGDGIADDTAALQASIDRAYEAGGGTVYLDRGSYKITSQITVKPSVWLCGDFNSPTSNRSSVGDTVILLDGDFSSSSPFVLCDGAKLSDMVIYSARQSLDEPQKLSATVTQSDAKSLEVENILMLNTSTGMDFSSDSLESVRLKNIYMTAFYSALTLNGNNLSVKAENININPSYLVSNSLTNPDKTIKYDDEASFFKDGLTAVHASVKSLSLRTADIDAANSAFVLGGGSGRLDVTNVTVTNAVNAVTLTSSFGEGASFCGCAFGSLFGTENANVKLSEEFLSSAVFSDCIFSGNAHANFQIRGDCRALLYDCTFSSWKDSGIETLAGTASVCASKIIPDSNFAIFDDNSAGVFFANSYFSTLKYTGGQIFSTDMALANTVSTVPITVQTPNSARAFPKRTQVFYPDGTDSSSLQKAVDEAYAAGGGIVFAKEGSYLLSETVTVSENVWICGAGIGKYGLKTDFSAQNGFKGTAVFDLKTGAAVCNAKITDLAVLTEASIAVYEKTAVWSQENSVTAGVLDIKGFSIGIAFSQNSGARVFDVRVSSYMSGMIFSKTDGIAVENCLYGVSEGLLPSTAQAESGIGFYFQDCVASELFDCSANAGSCGLYVSETEEPAAESEIAFVVNGYEYTGATQSIAVDGAKLIYIINSRMHAPSSLLQQKGDTVAFFCSWFNAPVASAEGGVEFTACAFGGEVEPLSVNGGTACVTACAFENNAVPTHISVNSGSAVLDANLIVTDTLYTGASSGYLRYFAGSNAVVYDNYNMKRVDYSNVD